VSDAGGDATPEPAGTAESEPAGTAESGTPGTAESGTPEMPESGTAETAEIAEAAESGSSRTPRWRRVLSIVLLVVGFVLIPLSGVALWSRNQLLNTDRYVDTVSPLAGNADIQHAVSTAAVDALFSNADVQTRLDGALPARLKFLGSTLTTAVEGQATKIADTLLASGQFQTLWDDANRRAHSQLVALLKDDPGKSGGSLAIKNGAVSLDVSKIVSTVQARLVDAGLSFLANVKVPPVSATVKIIDSEGLSEARSYASLLNTIAWILPVLGLGALIASALIVRTRRRATIRAALVLIGACVFTLVLLAVGRSFYLDAVKPQNKDAAAAMFDILIRNLRYGFIVVGFIGIVVAIAAFFSGPSAPAVRARSLAAAGISGARSRAQDAGYEGGPVARFAGSHRRGLELSAVAVVVLIFLAWGNPSVGTVLFLALVCLLVIGAVEFLARDASEDSVDSAS
jgi:hypothetical protein